MLVGLRRCRAERDRLTAVMTRLLAYGWASAFSVPHAAHPSQPGPHLHCAAIHAVTTSSSLSKSINTNGVSSSLFTARKGVSGVPAAAVRAASGSSARGVLDTSREGPASCSGRDTRADGGKRARGDGGAGSHVPREYHGASSPGSGHHGKARASPAQRSRADDGDVDRQPWRNAPARVGHPELRSAARNFGGTLDGHSDRGTSPGEGSSGRAARNQPQRQPGAAAIRERPEEEPAAASASASTAAVDAARRPQSAVPAVGEAQRVPPLLAALYRVIAPLEEAGYAYCAVRRTAAWLHGVGLPPRAAAAMAAGVGGAARGDSTANATEGGGAVASGPAAGGAARPLGAGISPEPGPGHDLDADLEPDLDLQVQWDQMKIVHELFSRPGSGWLTAPLQQLPAGRARFAMRSVPSTSQAPAPRRSPGSPPDGRSQKRTGAERATEEAVSCVTGSGPHSSSGGGGGGGAILVRFSCTYNVGLRANPNRVQLTPHPPPPPACSHSWEGVHGGSGAACSSSNGGGNSHSGNELGAGTGCGAPLAALMAPSASASAAAAGTSGRGLPQVWAQSLYSVGLEAERCGDTGLAEAVAAGLRHMQRELSVRNTAAWGRDAAYDAWVARFGPPGEAAGRLLRDPGRALLPLLPFLQMPDSPPLAGLRVANLCGSHGHKAVALAALGASVTVVDASAGNAAYARELAAAAGLAEAVSYVIADVAELPAVWRAQEAAEPAEVAAAAVAATAAPSLRPGQFDLVLMEMGVLHYFLDLRALMRDVVSPLLRPGGRLLLRDFHPVSTKLLSSRGKKHKATGDYFATQPLTAVDVAYSKYEEAAAAAGGMAAPETPAEHGSPAGAGAPRGAASEPRPTALLRRWGLGEVVSAVGGSAGLSVLVLEEEAGARLDDAGTPKVFTLLAQKPVRSA